MNNKITLIAISAFVAMLMSCNDKVKDEGDVAFSLSDTMLAKSKFVTTKLEDVKNEVRLFGKISADINKTAQVYPIVGGIVTNITVEIGDYVKQGQVMATIRSGEVAQFQKERLDALNDLAISEKNLQVAKDLFQGKLNSEKDVTAAEKDMEKARAELDRVNELYKIYSLKEGSIYNVVAPISGFVLSKKINQNEQIRSDNTEPLFSIAEINKVWALANVNESDIPKIKVGYDADVKTLAFPDDVYSGSIDKIFNAIDVETKSMKVRVQLPNSDLKLKPEMNCTVSVKYKEDKQMISVPSSSVIFDKSKFWVMVYKDKYNIETRRVDVYRQLGDVTYISSGLNEEETIITENGLLIYDALND